MPYAAAEHVFEIRYKPDPEVLDHRGAWTEALSSHMGLSEWQITDNRLDLYDKTKEHHCFVSFRSAGYVVRDASTDSEFRDQALTFFRFVLDFPDFPDPLSVQRIGVRGRYLTSFPGTFDSLVARYKNRYLNLSGEAAQAIAANLVDIGGALNFSDEYGNFNTTSGPMPQAQARQFFSWKPQDQLPEVALYYDIDYWLKPDQNLSSPEILRHIEEFANQGSARHKRIQELILRRAGNGSS